MAEMFIKAVVGTILFCFVGVTFLTGIMWLVECIKDRWFK